MIYTNSVSKKCEGTEAMDIRATDNVQDCNSKYDYEGKLAIYVAFKLRGVVGNYKVANGIYVSPLQMFNLSDFVIVRPLFYSSRHADGCLECSHLVELAKAIKEGGTVEFANTYRMIFSNFVYKRDLVIRKIMQLPVSVFRMQLHGPGSAKLFVTAKIDGVDYNSFVALLQKVWQKECSASRLNKKTLKELCNLASSNADKLLIKYVCCEAQNLSMNKAKKLYGFQNFQQQKEKINDALEQMKEIHEVVEELAKVKDETVLKGFGISLDDDLSSGESGNSATESDGSEGEQADVEWLSDVEEKEDNRDLELHHNLGTGESLSLHLDPDSTLEKNRAIVSPIPSQEHLLFMLRANNLNWFAFVTELPMLLRNHTKSVLTQALCDFSHQLSFLDLPADEEQRIERSRQAYLAREREKTAQDTLSDDESDSANQWFNGDLTEQVLKKRKKYKRKHARLKAQKIAEARLLRKKIAKRCVRILKRFQTLEKM